MKNKLVHLLLFEKRMVRMNLFLPLGSLGILEGEKGKKAQKHLRQYFNKLQVQNPSHNNNTNKQTTKNLNMKHPSK